MRQAVVDDFTDEGVSHSVERLAAVLTSGNELEPAQERELMAERRHSQIKGTRQVADTQLTVRERVHDADADRIGQRLEHLRGIAHGLFEGETGSRRLDAPVIVLFG
jgi:hypothetical protein